jgi:glycosyltransferase A (GT-A) superfamily protein (DUF2064 family)
MLSSPPTPPAVKLHLVAKFPRLGRSKTRLGASVGAERALEFARACVGDLAERLCDGALDELLCGAGGVSLSILFSPASDLPEYRSWLSREVCGCESSSGGGARALRWSLEPMAPESAGVSGLGHILGTALALARAEGFRAAVFVGMDTPELCPTDVSAAASDALSGRAAHLVAAADGGYVLLAVPCGAGSAPQDAAAAFSGVAWSTPAAFATQARALLACGLELRIGARVYEDVDTLAEYEALGRRLAAPGAPLLPRLARHFAVAASWSSTT